MLPCPAGFVLQVTVVFDVPETDAVNGWAAPAPMLVVDGLTTTLIGEGFRVTVVVPCDVLSAALVATIVTDWTEFMIEGAVYSPAAVIVPTLAGLTLQVTVVFVDPVTDEVNCWVCDGKRLAFPGVTETEIGGANLLKRLRTIC
jgi:hypothetical protein